MTKNEFRTTIHMVASVDGIIAKRDNSISWFDTSHHYDKGVDAPNHEEFLKNVDCFVMGSHTYEHAFELSKTNGWPYGDKPTIVLTNRNLPVEMQHIEFYSGNLNELISKRLKPNYKNVWVVGGAMLTRAFIREKLADEIRISILPIILGDGLLFFDHLGQEQALQLKDTIAYKNGMVELCYELIKE